MSKGGAFFHSFQTCNLIGRSKKLPDGAMVVQEDQKEEMEILCKLNGNFRSDRLVWSTSKGRPFVLGNFRLIRSSICVSTG